MLRFRKTLEHKISITFLGFSLKVDFGTQQISAKKSCVDTHVCNFYKHGAHKKTNSVADFLGEFVRKRIYQRRKDFGLEKLS